MKLWQRRKATRNMSGWARRVRAWETTSRVPTDSSASGQSPMGVKPGLKARLFFLQVEKLQAIGPEPIVARLDLLHERFEFFEIVFCLIVVAHAHGILAHFGLWSADDYPAQMILGMRLVVV